MADRPIKVMIVDDSALMRNLVTRIFESNPGFQVAATAMNGMFALKKLDRARPDLIVLDIEMPEMNGIEFLRERQKRGIDVPVIILSSLAEKGARITMEALALGASDFVLKPGGVTSTQEMRDTAGELIEIAKVYAKRGWKEVEIQPKEGAAPQKVIEARPPADRRGELQRPVEARRGIVPLRETGPIEVVAIGISTGGPNALREFLPGLGDLAVPMLVVQHMPAGFTGEFAQSLDRICDLEVREAKDGDLIKPGRVFIAPGNSHMSVEVKPLARTVHLSEDPPVNGHRPSADVLFSSVAKVYGNRSLGVIMTGMGRDGAAEMGSIYREGGFTIAQDETSSVVFGMPRVAIESGVIREVVPLSRMAETIKRLAREHPQD
jgi:two-component system chemotaxis response regulator CheB